ncbi:uncharacterized protein N7479_008174 [Penicillium vulpinum]|uniref:F-box domain-containing protein n=1 Tax=Penicillium vulpinum TaxID=29845 RepID=A0A1V6RIP8_9EURO|nr:uncharacterized protein N7479_008174 [Penicillium vulpinum]KAJ5961024.1 hypothetical protein N7479_008174 [Penicillium vulpinum]OQE01701.1 hypothetical protein PENVUL_c041G07109 [Penicillium vulpinum]
MESAPFTGLLSCPQEIIGAILAELQPNRASIAALAREPLDSKLLDSVLSYSNLENLTFAEYLIKANPLNRLKYSLTHSTPLKNLWLLNCCIGATSLAEIMKYPRALKPITFKDEYRIFKLNSYENQTAQEYVKAIGLQASSLESLDLDVPFSRPKGTNLASLSLLRDLTISPSHLAIDPDNGDHLDYSLMPMVVLLPRSLERLTFRYLQSDHYDHNRLQRNPHLEEYFYLPYVYRLVSGGKLPRLSRFTCVVTPPLTVDGDVTRNFTQAFDELGVQFMISKIDNPITMPEIEECKQLCQLSNSW